MGCLHSKVFDDEQEKINVFKVYNIDKDGNSQFPGKIELWDEHLILHQKKKGPISWPIRTLRRYGCESDIFSFEAGRRCASGEGIFAFRCEDAQQLFRVLHAYIQRNGMALESCNLDYVEPRRRLTHISIPSREVRRNDWSSPILNEEYKDRKEMLHSYTNIDLHDQDTNEEDAREAGKFTVPPTIPRDVTEFPGQSLNYCILDVNENASAPSIPQSRGTYSTALPEGYSSIDFVKTLALKEAATPNIENDIGCKRRTRHNSHLIY